MPERTKPPFRADHVGSLIRPQSLIAARERAEKGEIAQDEFMAAQGMTTLRDGPRGWDAYGGKVYRSWDGVSAMWGTLNGYLYVGFGDPGVDPRREFKGKNVLYEAHSIEETIRSAALKPGGASASPAAIPAEAKVRTRARMDDSP